MAVRRLIAVGSLPVLLATVTLMALPAPQQRQTSRAATRSARTAVAASPQKRVVLDNLPGDKTVVQGDLEVQRVDRTTKDVALASNQYVVARWKNQDEAIPPVVSRDGKAWSLGFGFIGVTREGQEIHFRPVIEASGGLALTGNGSNFEGRVFVGLRDNTNPAASYKLPQPVSLLVSAPAEELMPRQLSIDHTNLPFAEVTIGSKDPPDPIDLSLIAAGTSERATIQLPVLRPHLELIPARSRIQGLGLETSTVSIRAIGLPDPEGRIVTVTSDFASVDPTQVALDAQGVGTTTVRSVSFGQAAISAISPPLAPTEVPIQFSWPIAFLLASVTGGLLGAAVARFQSPGKKKSLPVVLIRGVLTGIIMVALYGIGVNLLPIHPTASAGEALAFGVAAIGAFLGLKVK